MGDGGVPVEDGTVDEGIVTLPEDALLDADADDAVAIEGLAESLCPLVELQLADTVLDGLDVGLVLDVVGDALEARTAPVIALLVLLEELCQTGLVLGGLVPDVLVADLIEEQALVILADEVLQLIVIGREFGSLLLHDIGGGQLAARLADERVDHLLGNLVADATLLHKLEDALAVLLEGFKHLVTLPQDDVVAVGGLDDARHLAVLQGEGHVLVLLDELAALHEGQQTTLLGRAGVLAHLLGQFGEVGAGLQGVVDRVNTNLGGLLLGLGGLLVEAQQDMGGLDESVRTNLLDGVVVDVMGLLQHVGIGDHGGEYLLVTVLCELLLEGGERVITCLKGSGNLQLIIDEEVNVLVNGLLVDDAFGVVLVVAVLELGAEYGLAVDGHDNRVVLLRHSRSKQGRNGGYGEESRDEDILFHLNHWDDCSWELHW